MTTRARIRLGLFSLEAINSFALTFYLYYLYFLMQDEFGFTTRGNLFLTAVYGFVYLFASWQGGRFAQRHGYFKSLRLAYVGMTAGLALGWIIPGAAAKIIGLALWTVPLCLIWPTLEALLTEGEDYRGTARTVGIYNVVWAATAALAFCSGGWLWEKAGKAGLYGLPMALMILQLILTMRLEKSARELKFDKSATSDESSGDGGTSKPSRPARQFLKMAWLANPFAYVAINTVAAVIPQITDRFHLSPAQSGVFCSIWFYARLAAFVGLWIWPGWHYQFRWLLAAYVGMVAGFAALMFSFQLWWVAAAQVVFGFSIALIYYSSLFYSMDAGEAKGHHGGLHEAAIGLGIFCGPAVGAATLTCLPHYPGSGALAVTGLLLCGLAGLFVIRRKT